MVSCRRKSLMIGLGFLVTAVLIRSGIAAISSTAVANSNASPRSTTPSPPEASFSWLTDDDDDPGAASWPLPSDRLPGETQVFTFDESKHAWKPRRTAAGGPVGQSTMLTGAPAVPADMYFFVDDGCALGHTPKDIGAILSLAIHVCKTLSEVKTPGERIRLAIFFGHSCASRTAFFGGEARGRDIFGQILRHWFRALLSVEGKVMGEERHGLPRWTSGSDVGKLALAWWDRRLLRRVQWGFIFSNDFPKSATLSLPHVVLRPETWRWFKTPGQAALYRELFDRYRHQQLGVASSLAPPSAVADGGSLLPAFDPIVLTVLDRKKNRHYDAGTWATLLRERYSPPFATVQVVSFESGNALTYGDQLELLSRTNILVAAHGAALSNVIAMDPLDSVVIELFPHNFRYLIYSELALSCGLRYQAVEGIRVAPGCRSKCSEKAVAAASDEYSRLRQLNGFTSCKNCDIVLAMNMSDKREVGNSAFMGAVRNAIVDILTMRTRRQKGGGDGDPSSVDGSRRQRKTIRLIDRRG